MNKFKLFLICFLLINKIALADTKPQEIKIAAGGIMKSYFEIALKLCDFFEKSNSNLKCRVIETNGSQENIELLRKGAVDLALSQSDIAAYAFGGKECYDDPHLNLRQILRLYEEVFTVIAKDDDNIKIFKDLSGKKITSGPQYTGSSITYNKIKGDEFVSLMEEISPEYYAKKLCNGEIDAVVLVVGHPNKIVNHIANTCNVEFVTVDRDKMKKLIDQDLTEKAYHEVVLKKDVYPQIDLDRNTIGVDAILLSTENIEDEIIDKFLSYFKIHILEFKKISPMLEHLTDEYFTTGFIIPMHSQCLPADHK